MTFGVDELARWRDYIAKLHKEMQSMKKGKAQETCADCYSAIHLTVECPIYTATEEENFVDTRWRRLGTE